MGLSAVIQHDALRVLRKQGDQGLHFFLFARGQCAVAHLHLLICKAVGKPVGPCCGTDTVLGHSGPVSQAVKIGTAAQHHGCGCQCAGAAAALLEVEACVHVQINRQGRRQAGEHKHQCQHKAQQFFTGRCSGIHG